MLCQNEIPIRYSVKIIPVYLNCVQVGAIFPQSDLLAHWVQVKLHPVWRS